MEKHASPRRRALNSGRNAFTLIELLVVVAIIALLVGLLIPALAEAKAHAKTSACAANLHGIGNAYATYVANNDGVGSISLFSDTIDPNASPKPSFIARYWFGTITSYSALPTTYDTNGFLSDYYNYNTRLIDCPALVETAISTAFPITRVAYAYNPNTLLAGSIKAFKFSNIQSPAETEALYDAEAVAPTTSVSIPPGTLVSTYIGIKPNNRQPTFHGRHANAVGNVLWFDGHVSAEKPYLYSLTTSYSSASYSNNLNIYLANHIGVLTPVTDPESTLIFSTTYPNARPVNLDGYFWVKKDSGS